MSPAVTSPISNWLALARARPAVTSSISGWLALARSSPTPVTSSISGWLPPARARPYDGVIHLEMDAAHSSPTGRDVIHLKMADTPYGTECIGVSCRLRWITPTAPRPRGRGTGARGGRQSSWQMDDAVVRVDWRRVAHLQMDNAAPRCRPGPGGRPGRSVPAPPASHPFGPFHTLSVDSRWSQVVNATVSSCSSLSAGVCQSKVWRGRVLRRCWVLAMSVSV